MGGDPLKSGGDSIITKKHFLLPLAFWLPSCLKSPGAVSWSCSVFGEEQGMEGLVEKSGGCADNGGDSFTDSAKEECPSTETSSTDDSKSSGGMEESSKEAALSGSVEGVDEKPKPPLPRVSEIEMMKERFSKLLLGEDMSGCGKGVGTALAISNAITNLCATLFGQLWRLEPLPQEKKNMWRKEMECLLCISDHIVELMPTWQTFPDGSKHEVMTCRPRSDLHINLPALKKLDNMLIEILDTFSEPEFWYVDQGILAPDCDGSTSFRKSLQRQEEKWWLPIPRVPPGGLLENARKQLQHKRECTNQILKAAMAINSNALVEMEVPESYLESLPKNARTSLGDVIHRYISSDQFSPEYLLDYLEFSSEHQALEIANRVEASIYVWRRGTTAKPMSNSVRTNHRSSWGMVKEMMADADRRLLFADRAESLLLCLKQRFPGLTQTTLDVCKIQFNKDVGKSILESYSRVLESLAFSIVARIDDVLYVDDMTKNPDQSISLPPASIIAHNRITIPYSVPVSSTLYATAYATPSISPAALISPARGERSPFINRKAHSRGFGVKKVLANYLAREAKGRDSSNVFEVSAPISRKNEENKRSGALTTN